MCTWILSAILASAAEPSIAVMPMIELQAPPSPRYDSYVTDDVPAWRAELRRQRSREVAQLPGELARALPGALHAASGTTWAGHLRSATFPLGQQAPLERALRDANGDRLSQRLEQLGRRSDADTTLVMWTEALQSSPLTSEAFPGQLVHTATGPVFVDLVQEQHLVRARVGFAVIDHSGHILRQTVTSAEAVVSLRDSPRAAARQMAIAIAENLDGASAPPRLALAER